MENSTSVFGDGRGPFMEPPQGDEADYSLSLDDISEIVILSTIALVGITGNLLVVWVYSGARGQQTNAAIYILNLAAADLITLGIIVMLEISEFFKILWPIVWRYDIQCQLYRIGRFTCLDITVFLMVAIAIDRYIAVVHPLLYKRRCTTKRTKSILTLLWIAAAILATPVGINFLTIYNKVVRGPAHGVCAVGRIYVVNGTNYMGVYISVVLMFIPALLTGIIYTVLVIFVRKHNSEFATQAHDTHRRNHWKMAKVLLAVYLGYVAFYTPYLFFYVVGFVDRRLLSKTVRQILLELPYANSCVNPIIYLSMNARFREMVIKKFSRREVTREKELSTVSTKTLCGSLTLSKSDEGHVSEATD